ncbi:glutamate ligase domain-containing protein, partial [Verrucomicrobiota bacterium]
LLLACGVPVVAIEKAARAFQPLEHRVQQCAESKGVVFINDSKATNLSALAAAVQMQRGPVRLIAGGQLKEKNLNLVKEILAEKTAGLYLIGESALTMHNAWHDVCECRRFQTLEQATRAAWEDAQSGDVILLSPGCASFDQFDNFEQRGERFMVLARSLVEGEVRS